MSDTKVGDAILDCLEDLKDEKFRKFCHKASTSAEEPRIKPYEVEGKLRFDIMELLVSRWEDRVLDRTITILRSIGCNNEAKKLEKACAPEAPVAPVAPAPQSQSSGEHLVDRYQEVLTARVSNVNPILDRLLQKKVLLQEMYEKALGIDTTQNKMRFLYNGPLKSGGNRSKDEFQSALEELEPYLMKELKERDT